MRPKVTLAVALLVLFSVSLAGQEQKKMTMEEAMMKAGTPGEAHKKLAGMAGSWTTKATFWMAPGAQPMTMTGSSENKWVMGGRYLEQRFTGSFMGQPFEGLGYSGYDNVKGIYWGTWMDNMSTGMMMTTGTMDEDGKTWNFTGTMADPMTGLDAQITEKVVVTDNDHHTFEMWGPDPNGKIFKTMEIQYTRKK
jgi:hypothetical protein